MKQYDIRLAKVPQPPKDCTGEPVMLTDATIQERLIVEFEDGSEPKQVMQSVLKACRKVEPDCEIEL